MKTLKEIGWWMLTTLCAIVFFGCLMALALVVLNLINSWI